MENSGDKEEGIRLFRGIFLDRGKVKNLYDKELMEFMENFEIGSLRSFVDENPSALNAGAKSTFWSRFKAKAHDRKIIRKMKEYNANLVLMQISNTKIYYDYCWAD